MTTTPFFARIPLRGNLLLLGFFVLSLPGQAEEAWERFAETALRRVEEKPHVRGEAAEWFFSVRELKHLGTGKFWEKPWEEVARNQGNPISAISEFQDLLEKKGIGLILVPVPPKAAVYPEKLDAGFSAGDALDPASFLEQLRSEGITVLDLQREFLEQRKKEEGDPLYCRQDSHYSPRAIERIAEMIVEASGIELRDSPFSLGKGEKIQMIGDQIVGSEWEGKVGPEELSLRPVLDEGKRGVEPNPGSRFLLLGDSHTLVFQQGEEFGMHTSGAGLLDHLSLRFGEAFDLVGVRGSGMVQARKQLFYRAAQNPGYWNTKELVVWVFTMREFTQSIDRLISIPLER